MEIKSIAFRTNMKKAITLNIDRPEIIKKQLLFQLQQLGYFTDPRLKLNKLVKQVELLKNNTIHNNLTMLLADSKINQDEKDINFTLGVDNKDTKVEDAFNNSVRIILDNGEKLEFKEFIQLAKLTYPASKEEYTHDFLEYTCHVYETIYEVINNEEEKWRLLVSIVQEELSEKDEEYYRPSVEVNDYKTYYGDNVDNIIDDYLNGKEIDKKKSREEEAYEEDEDDIWDIDPEELEGLEPEPTIRNYIQIILDSYS